MCSSSAPPAAPTPAAPPPATPAAEVETQAQTQTKNKRKVAQRSGTSALSIQRPTTSTNTGSSGLSITR